MTVTYRSAVEARGATLGAVIRAELIKISSLRSTWGALALVATLAGLVTLLNAGKSGSPDAVSMAGWLRTPLDASLFLVAVFAAVQAAGEWSSGLYRTTFAAVPRRARWAAGRVIAAAIAGLALGVVYVTTIVAVGAVRTGGLGDLMGPAAWDVAWRAPIALALMAAFATALAILVRNAWLAAGLLFVLHYVLTIAVALAFEFARPLLPYLPRDLAMGFSGSTSLAASSGYPSPWVSLAVLIAWPVALTAAAGWAARRRDG